MKFFENSLRFRNVQASDCYRVHQLVDTFLLETCAVRTPYSFLHQQAGNGRDIVVLTRSIERLNQPGERERTIELCAGTPLSFASKVYLSKRSRKDNDKNTERSRSASEMEDGSLAANLLKHGLTLQSARHIGSQPGFLAKPGQVRIVMPSEMFAISAAVENQDAALEAVLHGIGKKRIFGFGMLVLPNGDQR